MSLVTSRFIGRLGNNMFQVAACIGYAKKHGMRWAAPQNTRETPNFHSYFPGMPKTPMSPGQRYEAHDPSMFGHHEIPHFPNGVTLVGFFQSLRYFENAQDEVRQAFSLNYIDGYEDCVSIHIRLGDYVQYSNSFPPVNVGYILRSCEHIRAIAGINISKWVIFSDDVNGAKKMFTDHIGSMFGTGTSPIDGQNITELMGIKIEFSEGRNEYQDLCLMASCGHHIIANSTFSWWGAWLGRNPDKIVVSPHHTSWFGPDGPQDTKDLIPDSWHQIKFR